MRHGSLFSGIGGFDLAAQWMGWTNVFHCEWNEFGQRVLKHYWPDAISYGDITKTDFTVHRGNIDILTGGFPCQPYSMAGKRKGKEDERHLWPEMLRAIREIKPTWVVGENVFGITNWDGGVVFNEVQADLEAEGYEVQPYVLPACAVNAPHRRDRVWFVAHRKESTGLQDSKTSHERQEYKFNNGYRIRSSFITACSIGASSDTDINGCDSGNSEHEKHPGKGGIDALNDIEQTIIADTLRGRQSGEEYGQKKPEWLAENGIPTNWQNFPTVSPLRDKYDGVSDWVVRHIKPEIYGTISKRYTDQDLQEVWKAFQSEEVRGQIRRLYKIHEPGILFQVLQLCSPTNQDKTGISAFSEDTSEELLRKLRKYGTFGNTPQGRELEKQFREQFADTLPFLSHEIALVAMEVERRAVSAISKWRNESIKAMGNAIVPQVALQVFKAIEEYKKIIS